MKKRKTHARAKTKKVRTSKSKKRPASRARSRQKNKQSKPSKRLKKPKSNLRRSVKIKTRARQVHSRRVPQSQLKRRSAIVRTSRLRVSGKYENREKFTYPLSNQRITISTMPDLLRGILKKAQEVLPIYRHFYEFYIVIKVQEYYDEELKRKKGKPYETVNSVAAPPDYIVQAWMDQYSQTLKHYKRKAWAKRVTVVRVSDTKNPKFKQVSQTSKRKPKTKKVRNVRYRK